MAAKTKLQEKLDEALNRIVELDKGFLYQRGGVVSGGKEIKAVSKLIDNLVEKAEGGSYDERQKIYKKLMKIKNNMESEMLPTSIREQSGGVQPVGGKTKKVKKERKPMSQKQKQWMDFVGGMAQKPKYKDVPRSELMKIASAKYKKNK